MPVNTGAFEIACELTQKEQKQWPSSKPLPSSVPGGVNTSPAQPCPHFTCTQPFQPPTPARILSTKSHNLSTLAFFWLLNSLCTSQHLATVEAIRRASQGQALALVVSYLLRYDKNSSQLTPTQNLSLWKSIVLPHFLQNLRYILSRNRVAIWRL